MWDAAGVRLLPVPTLPCFLHAADLHLDSPLRGLEAKGEVPIAEVREASRRALAAMVDAAIERKVEFVVLAGDIYDSEPAFSTYRCFHRQMQRLSEAGIPVAIVLGNHDHAGVAPRAERLPTGVRVLPSERPSSLEIVPGVFVHGQSYPRRDIDSDLSANYPAPVAGALNLGLLHTALDGHSGEHARYAPSSRRALAAHGYQYWALGHVHGYLELVEEDGGRIVYPGNLQGRHARECGPKGAVFVEYQGSRILDCRHQAFDQVRWHHLVLPAETLAGECDPVERIEQALREETADSRQTGRHAAIRLSLAGQASRALLDLGAEEIRESLIARFDGDPTLHLERIELFLQPGLEERGESERQLARLSAEMAEDPAFRRQMLAISRDLHEQLRKTDRSLADLAARQAHWLQEPDTGQARSQLDDALLLVRELLHGRTGR